jgi:hypothetical protein
MLPWLSLSRTDPRPPGPTTPACRPEPGPETGTEKLTVVDEWFVMVKVPCTVCPVLTDVGNEAARAIPSIGGVSGLSGVAVAGAQLT